MMMMMIIIIIMIFMVMIEMIEYIFHDQCLQWRSNLRLDEGLVEAITPQVELYIAITPQVENINYKTKNYTNKVELDIENFY